MKIKNAKDLNNNFLRTAALMIAERGISELDTAKAIKKAVRVVADSVFINSRAFPLTLKSRLVVVCIGKCAIDAALALEEVLKDKITDGVALDVRPNKSQNLGKIKHYAGTHPMPSKANVFGTQKIVKILQGLSADDLVVFVVSGGGSTLLCLPTEGMTCVDESMIISELFRAGATIQEINILRKHLSLARGGNLAKAAYPARVASLIISDVPGNELGFVASGPTVRDTTTRADAEVILDKYHILERCGLAGCGLLETPKDEKYFRKVYNTLLVWNERALEAMRECALELGFKPLIRETCLTGEARDAGLKIATDISASKQGTVHLYGGETTVTIRGRGRGGRNQELALSALKKISQSCLVLAIASDGKDNGPYAGAIVDQCTLDKAKAGGLNSEEFLADNDASAFFEAVGDFIKTGDTGSNVADLTIAINNL